MYSYIVNFVKFSRCKYLTVQCLITKEGKLGIIFCVSHSLAKLRIIWTCYLSNSFLLQLHCKTQNRHHFPHIAAIVAESKFDFLIPLSKAAINSPTKTYQCAIFCYFPKRKHTAFSWANQWPSSMSRDLRKFMIWIEFCSKIDTHNFKA